MIEPGECRLKGGLAHLLFDQAARYEIGEGDATGVVVVHGPEDLLCLSFDVAGRRISKHTIAVSKGREPQQSIGPGERERERDNTGNDAEVWQRNAQHAASRSRRSQRLAAANTS